MGRSNVWYAESNFARTIVIPKVLEYIEGYNEGFQNSVLIEEDLLDMRRNDKNLHDFDYALKQGLQFYENKEYYQALVSLYSASLVKEAKENPNYNSESKQKLNEETQIYWTRKHLNKSIQAYKEAGGVYTLSREKEKAADFDRNIEAISKITFSIGGFFGGYPSYIVELSEELKAYVTLWDDEEQPYGLLGEKP